MGLGASFPSGNATLPGTAAQHIHLAGDYLGGIPVLAFFVLLLASFESALIPVAKRILPNIHDAILALRNPLWQRRTQLRKYLADMNSGLPGAGSC